ncbi:hypothetical protein H0A70_12025 [Alcaligenaceae bacterium]|nr:hypothetical protein [Alcaligenaceae bacterium]
MAAVRAVCAEISGAMHRSRHTSAGFIVTAMPNFAVPCDKPVIAAVSGYVIGAGTKMVM